MSEAVETRQSNSDNLQAHQPSSTAPPGGVKVTSAFRKELFESTRVILDQLLVVQGLSCSGVTAEWLRDIDGNAQLVAVHHIEWEDVPAHHLHGIVSSLAMLLPPGVKGTGIGVLKAKSGGAKPGWNTNTKKMKTFQAGSDHRPDRTEKLPPSVHLPPEVSSCTEPNAPLCAVCVTIYLHV